jgi:hypothetical protein
MKGGDSKGGYRRQVMGWNTFHGFSPVIGGNSLSESEMYPIRSMNISHILSRKRSGAFPDGFRRRVMWIRKRTTPTGIN